MLYIITYSTHDEQYFKKLKNSYRNIIVLGYNTKNPVKNDKITTIINFCKGKNETDIVLYTDNYKSVILHTDNLLENYASFNSSLVFSKNLSGELYIGTCKEIIKFLKELGTEDNILYTLKKCNELYSTIKIDTNNKIFYIYNEEDIITIENGKINVNKEIPNVILSSVYGDIDDILLSRGNLFTRVDIPAFIKSIRYEIIYLILAVLILITFKNKKQALIISLTLVFNFITYHLFVKNLPINDRDKLIHIFINILFQLFKFVIEKLIKQLVGLFITKINNNGINELMCIQCNKIFVWKTILKVFVNILLILTKSYILGEHNISNITDNIISILLNIL